MADLTEQRETGYFAFETAELQGELSPGALGAGDVRQRHGVWRLRHKPTGAEIVHPLYSVLNLFRLFAVHQGMGQPRTMERDVQVSGNTMELTWGPCAEHRGTVTATYTVLEPSTVDLLVTVDAAACYEGYEVFLSNYFNPDFKPHVYVAADRYNTKPEECELIAPEVNDVYRGTGLVFTRDPHSARRCVDGRWDRSEFGWPTAQFNPQRHYGIPVALQTDPGRQMAAVLMARPQDCFAVTTGYDDPARQDAWKQQNPLYLSLFGEDLRPGDRRTARVRLVVVPVDAALQAVRSAYDAFRADAISSSAGGSRA